MSGTYDFIDGAVDSLKAGGHPFLLIALTPNDEAGFRYSIRSGVIGSSSLDCIDHVLKEYIPPYLTDIRNG